MFKKKDNLFKILPPEDVFIELHIKQTFTMNYKFPLLTLLYSKNSISLAVISIFLQLTVEHAILRLQMVLENDRRYF